MSSRIQYRVPYADTDQMGVVYYANYLVMFERVRNEILRDCGFSYDQIEKSGIGLPVIQAHVDYYKPSHYDDLLNITGWFEKVSGLYCVRIRKNQRNYCPTKNQKFKDFQGLKTT